MRGADPGVYLAPLFFLYIGVSFAPTAVGLVRHCSGMRKIILLNAAPPLLVFLLTLLFLYWPSAAGFGDVVILLTLCGGFLAWVSTMIDAATGSAQIAEEG